VKITFLDIKPYLTRGDCYPKGHRARMNNPFVGHSRRSKVRPRKHLDSKPFLRYNKVPESRVNCSLSKTNSMQTPEVDGKQGDKETNKT